MTAMSTAFAKECAPLGVRVNILCSRAIRSPMPERHATSPEAVPALLARFGERIPMGRVGRAEEAAEAVLWLCSNRASYVTGQTLVEDGWGHGG